MEKPIILSKADWEKTPGKWHGEFEGNVFGAGASVIFYSTEEIGRGPRLHRHPYDEIFIVRKGRALFTVGEEQFEAEEGSVVFGAANIAHKYVNLGPGLLETIDVHVSSTFIQEDLE